jgi:hypothetical protein
MNYLATALVECRTRTSQTLYLPQERLAAADETAAQIAADAWLAAIDGAAVTAKMPHLRGVKILAKTLVGVRPIS